MCFIAFLIQPDHECANLKHDLYVCKKSFYVHMITHCWVYHR